ncbi:MAG TPA: hypothetical protein PK490_16165, partial [Prosthecobacter sp.]|nr:hypothetical protein [Prosthecobacter sp.]
ISGQDSHDQKKRTGSPSPNPHPRQYAKTGATSFRKARQSEETHICQKARLVPQIVQPLAKNQMHESLTKTKILF